MGKSAYTDEEIKHVFQALFTEKKRLKELELQLDQLRKEATPAPIGEVSEELIEENQKLKILLANLKKKHEETLNAPSSNAPLNSQWEEECRKQKAVLVNLEENNKLLEEENKSFLRQLENLKSLLIAAKDEAKESREAAQRSEKALDKQKEEYLAALAKAKETAPTASQTPMQAVESPDAVHLKQQNQHLQISLLEAEEQNHRQKIRLEKLAQAIQEKEKRIHELHQYEITYKKAAEQRQTLQSSFEKTHADNEKLQADLTQSRQHAEQLERVIKFLRERSEEGQLAAKQFKEDFENSQETIRKLQNELHTAHEHVNKIRHTTVHVEQENEEIGSELTALKAQLEQLKKAATESQNNSQLLEASLLAAESIAQQEQENSLNLAKELNQQHILLAETKKEIDIIKQALIRGMREAHELQARFQESVQEKVAALNKFHHARQLLEKQEKESFALREELKQAHHDAEHKLANILAASQEKDERSQKAITDIQEAWELNKQAARHREEQLKTHFELELQQLKDEQSRQVEGLQNELRSLKFEHDECVNGLMQQIHTFKQELENAAAAEAEKLKLQEEYEKVKEELTTAGLRLNETLNSRQALELELQNFSARYHEKERGHSESQEQVNALLQEKQHLQNLINTHLAQLEEKETHIQMAQQHLAKKVKETALLSEELERHKHQVNDFQQQQVQHQIRAAELQASLDIHQQQERRLQEQLSDVIKTYDSQVKKWEQKYFEIQDKWQATELRKKELEKLEERHIQMQALLANLGSVMGSPLPAQTQAQSQMPMQQQTFAPSPRYEEAAPEPIRVVEPELPSFDDRVEEKSTQKPYQNLFNLPKAPPEKHRQNLFD